MNINVFSMYELQIHRNIPLKLASADVDDLYLDVFLGDAGAVIPW